jgi:hypothetical protein
MTRKRVDRGIRLTRHAMLCVAVVRVVEPIIHHEPSINHVEPIIHHEPGALDHDQPVILHDLHDSVDEEARNAQPIQEAVIERPAVISTHYIFADYSSPAESTGVVA